MTDINDWPGHPDADPDCECCLGDGLQADGETPCPCIDARKGYRAAQAASLTPDGLIDLIGEFGREVCCMLDDCETSGPVGEEVHTITDESLTKVSAILDRIDALPFEEPGVILGTGAMLQAAIKQTLQTYPPQPSVSVAEDALCSEILAELTRARAKFPGKNVTFAALVEEVGELATATFEESADRVRKEAVQVAVMAMRMILDGDHCYEPWRAEKGLDPLDPALRVLKGDNANG